MFKEEFLDTLKKYTSDIRLKDSLWNEIEKNYSAPDRHYHTLVHLNSMLAELKEYKGQFKNWDSIVFAIAYHDLIYSSLRSDNEERSAEIALKRLAQTSFPGKQVTFCSQLILGTKKHQPADPETNLFTDADLSILGADTATYNQYSEQVRREYSVYPDILYNAGRKKVLMHFLQMDSIYKTHAFTEKYELAAKANINAELKKLSTG
jgi:predicted metal-dependent HD superfamily phosphohydrolase